MSRLHKSIHKGAAFSGNASDISDDFHSTLSAKLNSLSIQGNAHPALSSNSGSVESRAGSLRSPLSRQESRQNSMLSLLVDPEANESSSNDRSDENSERSGAADSMNSSRDASTKGSTTRTRMKIYTVPDLIRVLGMSSRESTRSGIGKNEREVLFAHLYRMVISSNSEVYMGEIGPNDEDFINLFNLKNSIDNSSTDADGAIVFEWDAWIRCIDAYGCIGVDEVASDVVELVFPMLLKTISQLETVKHKDEIDLAMRKKIDLCIWSFMSLVLFIFYDSENYGMLEHARLFLRFVQNDILEDDGIVSSCLYMVGLALGLAWESGRAVAEFIEDEVLETVKLVLTNKKRKGSKLTAAVLTGLCFELLQKDEGDEAEDGGADDEKENGDQQLNDLAFEEFTTLAAELDMLANEGGKKSGKKGKAAKNVFREVLNTINKTPANDELDAIAVTKSKNIDVRTWFTYIRVQVLRFVLGNELSNWLAKSRDIRGMLKKKRKGAAYSMTGGDDYNYDHGDDVDDDPSTAVGGLTGSRDRKSHKELDKERTKQLQKERRAKEEELNK